MGYCKVNFSDNVQARDVLPDLVALVDVHGHGGIRFTNAERLDDDGHLIIKGNRNDISNFVSYMKACVWFDSIEVVKNSSEIRRYDKHHADFDATMTREISGNQGPNGQPNFG